MVRKSKLDDMFKPVDSSVRAQPKKSRKVENYHGSKVDIAERTSRQVSFWLPADLVESFQIRAVKEKKSNSRLLQEFIKNGLEKG